MRVVCDNCGASYKIPDAKLTREVNKATCRKCGNPILIRRPELAGKDSAAAGTPAVADERTLITSAAELERQARARATASTAGIDDAAVDPRPTQVSPDNSHTEATVPRDEQAERALAAAMPATAHPGAYVSTTLVPDALGHAPRPSPPPAMQVPSPIPPPAPMPAARAVAAYAPPPPAAPALAPAAPVAVPPPPPSVAPPPPPTARGAAGAHNPSGDLTFALLLSLVSVFGVLLVIANGLVQNVILAGIGTFLALLGGVGSALVVLTGNRGTRPASVVLALVGGFLLAFIGGIAQGFVNYTSSSVVDVVASTRAVEVPAAKVAPPPAAPAPAQAEPVAEPDPALALAAPPAEPAAVAAEAPPAAPAPAPAPAAAPPPAASVAASTPPPRSTSSTSSTSSKSSSSTSAPPPERIAPKTTSAAPSTSSSSSSTSTKSSSTPAAAPSTASTSSSSKSTSSSSSSSSSKTTEAAPAKASALDTRVIDTMIKNNKGVKLCFIKQKNDGGALPSGVKVKLTVQPSGTVSSAKIPSGEWKDTDFDGCLSGAVRAIQFPPFEGDPLTLTYPFPI